MVSKERELVLTDDSLNLNLFFACKSFQYNQQLSPKGWHLDTERQQMMRLKGAHEDNL